MSIGLDKLNGYPYDGDMAPPRIKPNPENATLAELETAAKAAATQREHNRFRAIIAVILGFADAAVAQLFGISEKTLRRWVIAFNETGIDGLLEEPRSGRPRKIPQEIVTHCEELLREPAKADQTHWTGVKFHGYLRDTLHVEASYSTLIRFLHEQNFCLKVPRPWPDRQDENLRREFREKLGLLLQDEGVEIWFGDESGFEADPRPRRRWAKKGEKVRVTRNGEHIRMNVSGIVCPRTGQSYFLEFSHTDGEIFQEFLDHANRDLVLERPRQILILDNASWHKRKNLNWGRFEVFYLPPYSPDFNPIERLWLLIKAEWFSDFIARDRQELIERLDKALVWAINRRSKNKNTCAIRT
jgi:transposase